MRNIEYPRQNGTRREVAFTLIELLVVVAIILILLGITVRVMSVAARHDKENTTSLQAERLKSAIEAFNTAKGIYPPCDGVKYTYVENGDPPSFVPNQLFTGLVYYLFYDAQAATWSHYLTDSPDDGTVAQSNGVPQGTWYWTNATHTIKDGWDREWNYTVLNDGAGY